MLHYFAYFTLSHMKNTTLSDIDRGSPDSADGGRIKFDK